MSSRCWNRKPYRAPSTSLNSDLQSAVMIRILLLTGLLAFSLPALSATIQRTITIDAALPGGGTSDWKTPTDITSNTGQFATDAEGDKQTGTATDLDYQIDSTGRDLKTFAYTYDNNYLYLWVERYASTSNTTDWWFYIDNSGSGPDGVMQSGEKLIRVSWQGSNGAATRLPMAGALSPVSPTAMTCRAHTVPKSHCWPETVIAGTRMAASRPAHNQDCRWRQGYPGPHSAAPAPPRWAFTFPRQTARTCRKTPRTT
jgi:hypothetical protein